MGPGRFATLTHMRILFVCTGNSCRSQIAEGFCKALAREGVEVDSAGTRPVGLHRRTVAIMKERGIELSNHRSRALADVVGVPDLVITLCANAARSCPEFPATTRTSHWAIADPVGATGSEAEVMAAFRTARGEIELRVRRVLQQYGVARDMSAEGGQVAG